MEDFDLSQLDSGDPSEVALWLKEMAEKTDGFLPRLESESVQMVDELLVALERLGVDPTLQVMYTLLSLAMKNSTEREEMISARCFFLGCAVQKILNKTLPDNEVS